MKYRALIRWFIRYRWSVMVDAVLVLWVFIVTPSIWAALLTGCTAGLLEWLLHAPEPRR